MLLFDGGSDGAAGGYVLEFAVFHYWGAVDQHVADADRIAGWIFVGGGVRHCGGIEEGEVGVRALADASFIAHGGDAILEALGGHEAHLADGVHQAERAGLANVAAQDAREGAGTARVALAVAQRSEEHTSE